MLIISMGYKVRQLKDLIPKEHSFGKVLEAFTGKDHPNVNIAYIEMTDDKKHYHKKITEFYLVVEGKGKIQLDNDTIEISPGTCIMIPPGTRHRATADEGCLRIWVVSTPSYDPNDKFPD